MICCRMSDVITVRCGVFGSDERWIDDVALYADDFGAFSLAGS
ncbi:hypothetical protein Hanom_Chr09g00849991 [Helianthus anomalus]